MNLLIWQASSNIYFGWLTDWLLLNVLQILFSASALPPLLVKNNTNDILRFQLPLSRSPFYTHFMPGVLLISPRYCQPCFTGRNPHPIILYTSFRGNFLGQEEVCLPVLNGVSFFSVQNFWISPSYKCMGLLKSCSIPFIVNHKNNSHLL